MRDYKLSGFIDEIAPDFETQLRAASGLGLRYACLRDIDGKRIQRFAPAEIETYIRPLLNQYGIRVSCIGSAVGKIRLDDEAAYRQDLEDLPKICQAAERLGCKYIRLFSFYGAYSVTKEGWDAERPLVIEKMKGYLDAVKGYDVVLVHENEKRIYGDSPERCLDLFNELHDPQFRLIFDFANFIQSGYEPLKCYERMKGTIEEFHIKDAFLGSGLVMPAGAGDGHVREILQDAFDHGYDGFLSLEPHLNNAAAAERLKEHALIPKSVEASPEVTFAAAFSAIEKIMKEMK